MQGILDVNSQQKEKGQTEPWELRENTETSVTAKLALVPEACEICRSKKFSNKGPITRRWEGLGQTPRSVVDIKLNRQKYKCEDPECQKIFFAYSWPYERQYQATPNLIDAICIDLLRNISFSEQYVGKLYGFDKMDGWFITNPKESQEEAEKRKRKEAAKRAGKKVSKILSYYIEKQNLDKLESPPCQTLLFLPIKQSRNTRCAVLGVLPKNLDHGGETVLLDVLEDYSTKTFIEFAKRRFRDKSVVKYIFLYPEMFSASEIQENFPNCEHVSVYPSGFEEFLRNLKINASKNIALRKDVKELICDTIDDILAGKYYKETHQGDLMCRVDEIKEGLILCEPEIKRKMACSKTVTDKEKASVAYPYKKDWNTIQNCIVPWLWGQRYLRTAQISADKIEKLEEIINNLLRNKVSYELLQFKLLYQYNSCYNNSNLPRYAHFLSCQLPISDALSGTYFYVPIDELAYVQARKSYIKQGQHYRLYGDYFNSAYRQFIANLGSEFFAEIFGQNQSEYHNWLSSVPLHGKDDFERNLLDETEEKYWSLIAKKMEEDGWPLGSKYVAESPDRLHIALLQILDHIQLKVFSDYFEVIMEE